MTNVKQMQDYNAKQDKMAKAKLNTNQKRNKLLSNLELINHPINDIKSFFISN